MESRLEVRTSHEWDVHCPVDWCRCCYMKSRITGCLCLRQEGLSEAPKAVFSRVLVQNAKIRPADGWATWVQAPVMAELWKSGVL